MKKTRKKYISYNRDWKDITKKENLRNLYRLKKYIKKKENLCLFDYCYFLENSLNLNNIEFRSDQVHSIIKDYIKQESFKSLLFYVLFLNEYKEISKEISILIKQIEQDQLDKYNDYYQNR